MNRLFLALALLAVTSLSSGCATCSSPYADCGGVFEDGYCRNELIDGRAGSAFAPQPMATDIEEAEPTEDAPAGEADDSETDGEETTDVYYEE